MANTKSKIKQGMGGSSSGKSRSEKTEDLKAETKKRRRLKGKAEIDEAIFKSYNYSNSFFKKYLV